jgi:hypothetical protein
MSVFTLYIKIVYTSILNDLNNYFNNYQYI